MITAVDQMDTQDVTRGLAEVALCVLFFCDPATGAVNFAVSIIGVRAVEYLAPCGMENRKTFAALN